MEIKIGYFDILIIAVIIYIIRYGKDLFRKRYLESILTSQKNPQKFLKEIEKDIIKQKNIKIKNKMKLSKVSGYFYLGDWNNTFRLLD